LSTGRRGRDTGAAEIKPAQRGHNRRQENATGKATERSKGASVSAAKIRLVAIGLRAQDLANATGIPKQALSRWIANPDRVNVRTLRKLGAILFCPPEALLDRTGKAALELPAPPANFLEILESRGGWGKGETPPDFADLQSFTAPE
jgi:DNA-binding Xre family transcriptional regulator